MFHFAAVGLSPIKISILAQNKISLRRIAHIINPFTAHPSSDLFVAQPITFQSMLNAREAARDKVQVDLLSVTFPEDVAVTPREFRSVQPLQRSVSDVTHFENPIRLPLIQDILQRLYEESDAEYLVYTNVDIGLYPNFYLKVNEFIDQGFDAFIINRRRIPAKYSKPSDLEQIVNERGEKHPGFDCFVFHRSLFPKFHLRGICIGVPFIEISFSQNLFAFAGNFKLFESETLTFHLGMEIYKRRAPREYFWYNRKQFHLVEKDLFPYLRLSKFPYAEENWLVRLVKYGLHPCIPIRLVLKLWWRSFVKRSVLTKAIVV